MENKILFAMLFLSCLLLSNAVNASEIKSDPITTTEKTEVIKSLGTQLNANYVFPDVAKDVANKLLKKNSENGYAKVNTKEEFAKLLSSDLREIGKDLHFRVDVRPDFHQSGSDSEVPTKEEVDKMRKEIASWGFGIARVERLSGNVGYIDLRSFPPTEYVARAYDSALSLLSGTEALIIDLRQNGGGSPDSVAYFMSHFFGEGDERHLNDLYYRPENKTREYWTNPAVGERYTKPVYVLVSSLTFSAAEECSYNFQTQKRATLVGETTGGGANPGGAFSLGSDLVAFISTGKAINPITHTNWEHVGVKPDINVPASQALFSSYAAILESLIHRTTDPADKQELEDALAFAKKGEVEQPSYEKRF